MDNRKKVLLEREGYKYHFTRMVYFNRHTKKMFSQEFIDDNPAEEILRRMTAAKTNTEWEFNFNRKLSAAAKEEILSEFGQ